MPSPRTAIDLFAGAGGLSLAAEAAGFSVSAAVEVDAWACETLRANGHERVIERDIAGLTELEIRTEFPRYPELLMGGPPCQGFSHAGVRTRDPRDPRNTLFQEFVRVARLLEPRAVLIENVPGLLRSKTADGAPVADIIVAELEALGYTTVAVQVEARDVGVPQIRPRVFFLGLLDGDPPETIPCTHTDPLALDLFSTDLHPWLTVDDAISDLPLVDVGSTADLVPYEILPQNNFQREMRARSGARVENHVPMRHTQRSIARFRQIQPGQSQSDVGPEFAPAARIRAPGGPAVSYDQNNRRMHGDKPCHTLAASFYANFLHPRLHRNFTPREGARLQTFPDHYVFRGKRTVVSRKLLAREGRTAEQHLCQYQQIGNAVPPRLGAAVIESLTSNLKRHREAA